VSERLIMILDQMVEIPFSKSTALDVSNEKELTRIIKALCNIPGAISECLYKLKAMVRSGGKADQLVWCVGCMGHHIYGSIEGSQIQTNVLQPM
jgi:hypothetical protein